MRSRNKCMGKKKSELEMKERRNPAEQEMQTEREYKIPTQQMEQRSRETETRRARKKSPRSNAIVEKTISVSTLPQ